MRQRAAKLFGQRGFTRAHWAADADAKGAIIAHVR
jgi:hypothetical protein